MMYECPTHGTIPAVEGCPICDVEPSVREMCRRVLTEWVASWPDPQNWKHETRWQDDGVAVMSQHASQEAIWQIAHHITRPDLQGGHRDIVKLRAVQAWRDLHKTIEQQEGDTWQ